MSTFLTRYLEIADNLDEKKNYDQMYKNKYRSTTVKSDSFLKLNYTLN